MSKNLCLFLLLLLMFNASGQSFSDKAYHLMLQGLYKNTVPFIKAAALEKSLEGNSQESLVLLDTRSYEEFVVSHLRGARFMNYENFKVEQLKHLPKSTHVVVYCSVGYRSEKVGEQLKRAGYLNVYNLYGGIFEWVNKGFPVFSEEGQTQKVHAYSRAWGIWLTKGEKVYE